MIHRIVVDEYITHNRSCNEKEKMLTETHSGEDGADEVKTYDIDLSIALYSGVAHSYQSFAIATMLYSVNCTRV